MRQAPFLAAPLLTFALSAFAQQGTPTEPKPELVPENQPFSLKAEALPSAKPDRLMLNQSKSEFRIQVEQQKLAAAAAAAGTSQPTASGMPLPASPGVPSTVDAPASGGFSLTQPGLPAGAKGAPLASGAAAPAASASAAAVDVVPPAPVPRTMAQAAEALPKPTPEATPQVPAPVAPAAVPAPAPQAKTSARPLDLAMSYIKTHPKEALMGAAGVLLLIIIALRLVRRRASDDSGDE